MSTPGRCIERWRGKVSSRASISLTTRRVPRWRAARSLVVGDGVVLVDGEDVARAIRTPEIDAAAAAVARLPRVREVLIAQQREMGRAGGVVMEGRDIGTVVFPAADVKVYLDATPEERARRRAHDPAHALGEGVASVGDVATALEARDRSDRTRTTSPLTMATDAVAARYDWAVDRAGDRARAGAGHRTAGRLKELDSANERSE